MHHAAMANKKEMMFLLARLGCDWRARAEGIDGATAAFVLCGQHGKTTRQQVAITRPFLFGDPVLHWVLWVQGISCWFWRSTGVPLDLVQSKMINRRCV